jgi:hypothetical protein
LEPLSNKTVEMHVQTQRLMERIYELRRCEALRCHDIHTKSHKIGSDIQNYIEVGFTDNQTASCKPSLIFSKRINLG